MGSEALKATDLSARRWMNFVLWRVPQLLILVGVAWPDGIGPLWTIGFMWIGAACSANALRCGRVHCSLMGPLFIGLGLISMARTLGLVSFGWGYIGAAALASVLAAYFPEFLGKKYFGARASCDPD